MQDSDSYEGEQFEPQHDQLPCQGLRSMSWSWGAEYERVNSRKLGGYGGMLPQKICEIWVPRMAGNALEMLWKYHVFVSVSSSGMGTFVKKIKGMDEVGWSCQKAGGGGERGAQAPPAPPPAWPLHVAS